MAVQIQFRRGTAASWTSANTVLAEGEMGLETDTSLFKIGDGTTAWNSLAYGGFDGTATLTQIGISSGTDIGAAIADDDKIALYDTSVGANRRADASRVKTYVFNVIDAAGDLLVGTAADTVGRLALGTSGYVLKSNGTSATWSLDPITDAVTTKGDLIAGTAADTVARLGVGTNGQALLADSSTATGLAWGAAGVSGDSDQLVLGAAIFG